MPKDPHSPERAYKKLMAATNMANEKMFAAKGEAICVRIRPLNRVPPGKFLPDPDAPGHYMAHPTTIKAIRKDLFVAGNDEFLDLEDKISCPSCSKELDRQFWHFCPFCEGQI